MKMITLKNVGAIERLSIPIPESGGVVVLRGRNGCGKSTALDAVSALISGKGTIPKIKDGERVGGIEGFGSKIMLSVSASRRGGGKPELVIDSVEGRFSIADLVNPPIKDAKAADKARIKALITLTGREASCETFHSIFETKEEFDYCVSKSSTETSDPILMAERIKRDIEEKARIEEKRAELAFAEYNAKINGTEYDPADLISDFDAHNAEYDAAIRKGAKLLSKKTNFLKIKSSIERATSAIKECNIEQKESEAKQEESIIESISEDIECRTKKVEMLREQLAEIRSEIEFETKEIAMLTESREQSRRVVASIRSELESLEGYREIVEQSKSIEEVDESEIEAAKKTISEIRERLRIHTIALENKRKRDDAVSVLARAESIRDKASSLRDATKRIDSILTEMIGEDSPIQIVDGRMVVVTSRGETLYSDLSDGERWKVAFEIVSRSVHRDKDKTALLVIPQIGWESLDPSNQEIVNYLSKKYSVTVITAEATDGPIESSIA